MCAATDNIQNIFWQAYITNISYKTAQVEKFFKVTKTSEKSTKTSKKASKSKKKKYKNIVKSVTQVEIRQKKNAQNVVKK